MPAEDTKKRQRAEDEQHDTAAAGGGGVIQRVKATSSSSSKTATTTLLKLLPAKNHYHVSLMHSDVVTAVVASNKHGYVLTASANGIVKFWKRLQVDVISNKSADKASASSSTVLSTPCLEFVKSFTAHSGPIRALALDAAQDVACSVGSDGILKFYNIATFDVVTMIATGNMFQLGTSCCSITTTQQQQSGSASNITGGSSSIPGGTSSNVTSTATAAGGGGAGSTLWAVSAADTGSIYIFSYEEEHSNNVVDDEILTGDDDEDNNTNYNNTTTRSTSDNHLHHPQLLQTLTLHGNNPVTSMLSIPQHNCVVSTDTKGIVEVWSTVSSSACSSTGAGALNIGGPVTLRNNGIQYESKLDTDLYALVRKKTFCIASAATTTTSSAGSASASTTVFCLYGADSKIRIYQLATAKILVTFDERLDSAYDNTAKAFSSVYKLDSMEYGRRAAVEREMQQESTVFSSGLVVAPSTSTTPQRLSLEFDPSGKYLLVPTLVGIKILDWQRQKLVRIVGSADASQLRFVSICLASGDAKVNRQMTLARQAAAAGTSLSSQQSNSKNNNDADAKKKDAAPIIMNDSLLLVLAYNQRRFYVFSHVDPVQDPDAPEDALTRRDVWNEAPTAQDRLYAEAKPLHGGSGKLAKKAILRTTMGDIHIQLFADQVPKTVENFVGHSRSGYYDNVIFHRVIHSFMLQTGDPLGDGTGGESIWGGEFEDEFVPGLRHDRPFTVSMANAGPNTNGSQFFITTVPTNWLDNKHTVFGRVVQGMDVCTLIENVKTDDLDKPLDEIRILNVDVD